MRLFPKNWGVVVSPPPECSWIVGFQQNRVSAMMSRGDTALKTLRRACHALSSQLQRGERWCQRRIPGSRFGISRLSKGPWTWGTGGSSLKGRRAIKNGFGPALAAPAYGPGTEGAGTRVCGYAIKNSGLTVEVIRQHLHVCVIELRVKTRSPQG